MAVPKDPRTLELAEPFVSLFPVEPETLELVKTSMREHGYMADKPVLLWKDAFGERGRQVVVDGHTRLQAALDLKLPEIKATVRQFRDTDAAITAGIGEQVIRRNLNREQIAAYVVSILPLLDEKRGGLRTRTAKQLAALLGVSIPTIDRARGVVGSGDAELIARVKNGEVSLLAAYDQVTGRVAPPPAYVAPVEEMPAVDRVEMATRLLADPEVARTVAKTITDTSTLAGRLISQEAVAQDIKLRRKQREQTKQAREAWERSRYWDVSHQVTKASSEISKVTMYLHEIKDLTLDRFALEDIGQLREDMAYLQEWMDRCLAAVDARLGENGLRKTIAAIRAKTVERGATPEEAAIAEAAAVRLEKKLDKKLTGGSAG